MSKKYDEIFNQIKTALIKDAEKDPNCFGFKEGANFNKDDFDKLSLAFINDTDFVKNKVKTRNEDGTVVIGELKPVEMFKKGTLIPLLKKFGVDDAEAKNILTTEIDSVKGLYEFCMSLSYEYMSTGRKLDFIPTEDFKGSLYLSGKDKEDVHEYNNTKAESEVDKKIYKEIEKHLVLKVKSSCPKNKKKTLTPEEGKKRMSKKNK